MENKIDKECRMRTRKFCNKYNYNIEKQNILSLHIHTHTYTDTHIGTGIKTHNVLSGYRYVYR